MDRKWLEDIKVFCNFFCIHVASFASARLMDGARGIMFWGCPSTSVHICLLAYKCECAQAEPLSTGLPSTSSFILYQISQCTSVSPAIFVFCCTINSFGH